LGSDAGLRAFRGKAFPALGELDVFAFAAAGGEVSSHLAWIDD